MRFRRAVNATEELTGAYHRGIQALIESDKNRVDCGETKRLTGSVNLEASLRTGYPNDPIWDYGIGWRKGRTECAIWMEVHPASSGHVQPLINKVRWLKRWLDNSARALKDLTREKDGYVWIASGGVLLQKTSSQARQLAAAGVSFPQRRLKLS